MMRCAKYALMALLIACAAMAKDNSTCMPFWGFLTETEGAPISGTRDLKFELFDAATGGSLVWSEIQSGVSIDDGNVSVSLGIVNPLTKDLLTGTDLWLNVTINPGTKSEEVLFPRSKISTTTGALSKDVINPRGPGGTLDDVTIPDNLIVQGWLKVDDEIAGGVSTGSSASGTNSFAIGYDCDATGAYSSVSGGYNCDASAIYCAISGGYDNTASDNGSFIGGGRANTASNDYCVIGGGWANVADEIYAIIVGGYSNESSGIRSTVVGGANNNALANYSTIVGGCENTIPFDLTDDGNCGFIGGGSDNEVKEEFATIVGGKYNVASGAYSFVGGGGGSSAAVGNTASGDNTVAGGGVRNIVSGDYAIAAAGSLNVASGHSSVVSGGSQNTASAYYCTVGGGHNNSASGQSSSIGGGNGNSATYYATVGGGIANNASGWYGTVSGGNGNVASNYWSSISGGSANVASGQYSTVGGGSNNYATGLYATIPGGAADTASGDYSFAAGCLAKAIHEGAFVWSGSNGYVTPAYSSAVNEVTFRSSGGYRIFTNAAMSSGMTMSAGGSQWNAVCDSTKKRNIRPVDTEEILSKVDEMQISQWSYKSQDESIEHISPMAQDFYALFGIGESDTTISTLDPSGVALAAIQELSKRVQELECEKSMMAADIANLKATVEMMAARDENVQKARFSSYVPSSTEVSNTEGR